MGWDLSIAPFPLADDLERPRSVNRIHSAGPALGASCPSPYTVTAPALYHVRALPRAGSGRKNAVDSVLGGSRAVMAAYRARVCHYAYRCALRLLTIL